MFNLRIRSGDWVVVCDGGKALILENAGDAAALNLKTKEVHEQADAKTSEQGTDAPGRSINSVDGRRSAMEQTDWHEQAEQRFLTELAKRLDAAVTAGETKALDHRGTAARARRAAPGLFERAARGGESRDRQGLCPDAGARDREASRRVATQLVIPAERSESRIAASRLPG